jgi:quinol-cytochrome oxidoreductase complex cytochrome b subunit
MEPVWATALTVLIPLTVIVLPFLDIGPEKRLSKRPIFLMVTIMGFLQFLIFSGLIIANIANIHRDPPIWRMGTWILIAIGVVWQYINQKIEKPEKLPVAIMDFVAYVMCPLFVLYWAFPTLLNGWITIRDQIIGVGVCMVPTTIAYVWHLLIRKKMIPVQEKAA